MSRRMRYILVFALLIFGVASYIIFQKMGKVPHQEESLDLLPPPTLSNTQVGEEKPQDSQIIQEISTGSPVTPIRQSDIDTLVVSGLDSQGTMPLLLSGKDTNSVSQDILKRENDPMNLSGYSPCQGEGEGSGRFGDFISGTDDEGRFVFKADLDGTLGSFLTDHILDGSGAKASFVDFNGRFRANKSSENIRTGNIRYIRFGFHPTFTRVSFTFKPGKPPEAVKTEVLCREKSLAFRLTLTGETYEELVPVNLGKVESDKPLGTVEEKNSSIVVTPAGLPQVKESDVLKEESTLDAQPEEILAPEAEVVTDSFSPPEESAVEAPIVTDSLAPTEKRSVEAAPKEATPPNPLGDNATLSPETLDQIPKVEEAPKAEEASPTSLTEERVGSVPTQIPLGELTETEAEEGAEIVEIPQSVGERPQSALKEEEETLTQNSENQVGETQSEETVVADVFSELPGYIPCDRTISGSGSGSFGNFSGRYVGKNIYIVEFPFRGILGKTKVRELRRKRRTRNVAYIDFYGTYSARETELRHNFGPLANMKYGRHPAWTRLSFNFLDDYAPSSAKLELFCKKGFLAIKLSMTDNGWRDEPNSEDTTDADAALPPETPVESTADESSVNGKGSLSLGIIGGSYVGSSALDVLLAPLEDDSKAPSQLDDYLEDSGSGENNPDVTE